MWSKEKRREYQREYDRLRYRSDDAYRKKKLQYYLDHRKERAKYSVEYRKKNADKIRAYQRDYHRNMRQRANDTGREEE